MKKMLCTLLIFALMFSTTCFSFASSNEVVQEKLFNTLSQTEKLSITNEIEEAKETEFKELYRQLEMQDALGLYDDYVEYLTEVITYEVMQKNNVVYTATYRGRYDGYTHGATAGYVTSPGPVTTISTYLDYDDSYYYVLSLTASSKFVMGNIIASIIGAVPNWGAPFTVLFQLKGIVTASGLNSIKNAGGYASIINMKSAMEQASYLRGWDTYPNFVFLTMRLIER